MKYLIIFILTFIVVAIVFLIVGGVPPWWTGIPIGFFCGFLGDYISERILK